MKFFEYGECEIDYLKKRDKKLGAAIDRIGKINREINPDLFPALINNIIGQQISTKAHHTIWKRFVENLGEITPQTILSKSEDELQKFGISFRKAKYINGAASAIKDGTINLDTLHELTDSEVCKLLSSLSGIGVWTAEMLMIFSLQRPDILSFGDLAILRGMRMLYGHKEIPKERFERYRKRYSPHGSVASLYLWAIAGGQEKN